VHRWRHEQPRPHDDRHHRDDREHASPHPRTASRSAARSCPVAQLLISALVRYHGEADAGTWFFNLAREVGLIRGSMSDLDRLEFWLHHVCQVQTYDWDPT
jgi:hypothetical protein